MSDPISRYFVDLCRELFQLEQTHGFTARSLSTDHVEITWRLTRGDYEILLMVEAVETYGIPTILFCPPARGEQFGLHEVVPALDPDHDAKRPRQVSTSMTHEQLRALLEHWAEFFHAHAGELLDDPTRTFAAIKRFRETMPDPYP